MGDAGFYAYRLDAVGVAGEGEGAVGKAVGDASVGDGKAVEHFLA